MAEQTADGGGTKVEQERSEAVEPERRPTYRTLDEQQGRLTEAEERFERGRRTIGLFLGPLVFLALLALPLGLEGRQQALAAVSAWSSPGGSPRPSRSRSPGWSGCACA